jgi:cytochrome c oxidase subunit 3
MTAHAAEHRGLEHHFESYEQQRETASLGMWLFIAQEMLFFGGLFTAYIVFRHQFPDAFAAASHHLDIQLGTLNTAVLIASSLTMALAVRGAQMGKKNVCTGFLIATMLLGGVFLGVKAIEYHTKYVENHIPGVTQFHWDESFHGKQIPANQARLFYGLYFAMTGLHALHMIVGIGILIWLLYWVRHDRFTPDNYNYVEGVGLYWHFVDIIWIFLFPLLYLIGRH